MLGQNKEGPFHTPHLCPSMAQDCGQGMNSLPLHPQPLSLLLQHVPQGDMAGTQSRVDFEKKLFSREALNCTLSETLPNAQLWPTPGLPECPFHPFVKKHTYWF